MWKREDGSRTYEAILFLENCLNQENAIQSERRHRRARVLNRFKISKILFQVIILPFCMLSNISDI